jgi:hypothetical protein
MAIAGAYREQRRGRGVQARESIGLVAVRAEGGRSGWLISASIPAATVTSAAVQVAAGPLSPYGANMTCRRDARRRTPDRSALRRSSFCYSFDNSRSTLRRFTRPTCTQEDLRRAASI